MYILECISVVSIIHQSVHCSHDRLFEVKPIHEMLLTVISTTVIVCVFTGLCLLCCMTTRFALGRKHPPEVQPLNARRVWLPRRSNDNSPPQYLNPILNIGQTHTKETPKHHNQILQF